ncbi:MAG: class I SAM-dependent methyltransferase [Chitinophagaceae bacterium]|nr:MAG: class I SAM-dependent methyltransferase [Chitinophagaceae bacterium]
MTQVSKDFNPPLYYPLYIIRSNLYKKMLKYAPLLSGKLMDFGCGSKPYKSLFTQVDEYIGVDYQGEGHSHVNEEIEVYYDGKTLPFEDNTFDSILANEVLEHIFNLEAILQELKRVLKPGGKILISIPFAWNEHEVPVDFGRYTSFGLTDIINRNGFNLIAMEKTTSFVETQAQLNIVFWHKHIFPRFKPFATILAYSYAFLANICCIIKSKIFPSTNDWYLNLVVLAEKK